MEPQEQNIPQLRMLFKDFNSLPDVKLPSVYQLRNLEELGIENWIKVLNATGKLGRWNLEKANLWLKGERRIIKTGTMIVVFEGKPVATSCTIGPSPTESRAELGWVAVSPKHQGQGLGYQTCLAVLHFAKGMGYDKIFLNTDDWRLPASKTYLKLGFEPEMIHETHPERWKNIYNKLDVGENLAR